MTWLGELNTAIVIMALIYWCVSKEFGAYFLMGWSGNRLANGMLKVTFLTGWILERRFVQFSTDISMMKRMTRLTFGLFSCYLVSLIFVSVIKDWITGVPGIFVSSYLQVFYVSFIFPCLFKHFEKT